MAPSSPKIAARIVFRIILSAHTLRLPRLAGFALDESITLMVLESSEKRPSKIVS